MLPIPYTVTVCDLGKRSFPVEIEGMARPNSVAGVFRSEGDGIASLQLTVNRAAIHPGSTAIRIRIRDDEHNTVRTSILTLTLQRQSRSLWAWLILLAGGLGGFALFVLRNINEGNSEHWYNPRDWWKVCELKSTLLALIAGIGAVIAVYFSVYSASWALGDAWWSTFLKAGGAFLGAATAASAAGGAIKDTKTATV